MKYCIEDNYNDLLNLFFGIQRKQAAGTVYMLVQNELYIIDTELIACSDKILINFKVSEDQKKKTENFKTYVCMLSKSNFDNGVFKINIENNEDISIELEIIELLTEKLYGYNTIRDAKGF